jgi:hypothetical protein
MVMADAALYAAKNAGRNRAVHVGDHVSWRHRHSRPARYARPDQ